MPSEFLLRLNSLNVIYPLFILLGHENKSLSPTYISSTLLNYSEKLKHDLQPCFIATCLNKMDKDEALNFGEKKNITMNYNL